jgi:glycosyltransferase involved in cell wall biosynthesis
LRVAFVHDWLTGMRGGEKVLELLLDFFPGAPIYTLLHLRGRVSAAIEAHPIHTSFIQRLPMAASRYRHYLPLFPRAVESFDLRGFDFLLSSSHCVAKGARPAPGARHLCYCHAPMRYAWDQYEAYFGGRGGIAGRWLLPAAMARLRRWDARTAGRAQRYVANSENVRRKIVEFWGVPFARTRVVHPPVDADFFTPGPSPATAPVPASAPEPYYLLAGAMVPYKRPDLAVAAFLGGSRRLVVAGSGPELPRLAAMAAGDPAVRFEKDPGDERLRALYRGARALLFPGEEDFGIMPLEAQACGTPVLALARGGALETVLDAETGLFFAEPGVQALRDALDRFEAMRFDPARLRRHAEGFSRERFRAAMGAEIEAFLQEAAP